MNGKKKPNISSDLQKLTLIPDGKVFLLFHFTCKESLSEHYKKSSSNQTVKRDYSLSVSPPPHAASFF